MQKRWTIIVFLLLCPVFSFGAGNYKFRHYTSKEGLSSNTVRALLQDSIGIIWIGTAEGLNSFDGQEMIRHELRESSSRYVNALMQTRGGELWVGTDDGAYRYDGCNFCPLDILPQTIVTSIVQDGRGSIWLGTFSDGLYCYDGGGLSHYLPGIFIENLFVSDDGRLWVCSQTSGEGLLVFNFASGTFAAPGFSYKDCSPARVCAIAQDLDGMLWLGTWDSGLYRADLTTSTVTCQVPYCEGFNHIHTILQDSHWSFLVGSDDGLLRINTLTGERELYTNDRGEPASLSNKFVYPIIKDHEGGLWVGTFYGGVDYVSPGVGQFAEHSLSAMTSGKETYLVSCFAGANDGTIFIGSENGGLFRYDPSGNTAARVKCTAAAAAVLQSQNIHALLLQGDHLWIGTYTGHLLRLNLRSGTLKTYSENLPSVYSLIEDSRGTVWAGTTSAICRYDAAEDRFTLVKKVGSVVVSALAADGGALWFATAGDGVWRYTAERDWDHLTYQEGYLPSNQVNHLADSPLGVIVSSERGLTIFGEERRWNLLEDADIHFAACDGRSIWMSSAASLVQYDIDAGRSTFFGASDGIFSSQFLPASGLVGRDGTIYIGSADGFLSFLPTAVKHNEFAPKVLFTRFNASSAGVSRDLLGLSQGEPIVVPWRLREISIHFAALTYWAPEKVRYTYRLAGLDRNWREMDGRGELNFNRLPAGRYRLYVRACNNSGIWSSEGEGLSFTVKPHPLRSKWAVALYFIMIGAVLYALSRYLTARTEKREWEIYEKRLDDDRQALSATIAERLEAPVTGIGVQLKRLKESPRGSAAIRSEIAVIEKNHQMLRGIVTSLQKKAKISQKDACDIADAGVTAITPADDFLPRLEKIIGENLANPDLSVQFLAAEMAISRSGLFAKCKELCGETPNNLINHTRLNAAAALLAKGDHSISEICYMVGFASPSYFSKSFSSQFGMTPHDWLKTHCEKR